MHIISGGVTAPKGSRPQASTAALRITSPPPAGEEGSGHDPLLPSPALPQGPSPATW